MPIQRMHAPPAAPGQRIARGWNRPVRPAALVWVGIAVLLTWLALVTASVWYLYGHWESRLALRNQGVRLRLPEGMAAVAEVNAPLRTHVVLQPLVRVPVRQTVSAKISDQLQARVVLHTVLPVETVVTVDQVVPVKTTLQTSVSLHRWLPRIPVTVPLSLSLPLRMNVPVKASVPVDLDMQVSGNLPPTLQVPIDTVFALRPQVHADIVARIVSETAFRLHGPPPSFDVTIERANLSAPFNLTFFKQREH